MNILLASTARDGQRWQQYVDSLPQHSHYHRWGWKHVIEKACEWPTYFFLAHEGARVCGVLPIAWQQSRLFGSFLTSLPFLNGGGIIADGKAAEEALLAEAISLARRLGVGHLELRFRRNPETTLAVRTDKVAVTRAIGPDPESMLRELPHKVRSDVRKAMKSGFTAELHGEEGLDDFYRIFAINMRELGTPVYGKGFFREILRSFPESTHICLVRLRGRPVATSFLMGYRDSIEAAWSASLYEYLPLKPNMFLYWSIFCLAGQKGYRTFDFGRSSVGSGTHRFKLQWGSQDVPLHWTYWLPEGTSMPRLNPQNPRYRLAIAMWKHLPLPITNRLGPKIARCLP